MTSLTLGWDKVIGRDPSFLGQDPIFPWLQVTLYSLGSTPVVRDGLDQPPVITAVVQNPDWLVLDQGQLVTMLSLDLHGSNVGIWERKPLHRK